MSHLSKLNRTLRAGGIPSDGFIIDGKHASTMRYAHKEVLAVARGIAHELYEAMMSGNNAAYAAWKQMCQDISKPDMQEAEFVRLAVPHLLDDARATLAGLLARPGNERLKEHIYDVLIKDNLVRGTGGVVPLAPIVKESFRNGR